MRRWLTLATAAALAAVTVIAIPTAASASAGPTITSDQADYAPGSLVTLTGAGWTAGGTVHVAVDDSAGQTWSYGADVVADDTGGFTDQLVLPNWFVAVYTVTATDGVASATTTFTDGNVTVSATSGTTALSGVTITYAKYNTATNCSGSTAGSGSQATPWSTALGIGQGQSVLLTAQASVTSGGRLYSFAGWNGASSSIPLCQAGSNGSGTISVTANYTDEGPVQASQTITFRPLSDKTYGDADFMVSATASSNLAVSYATVGNCTNTGATIHITGAGSCTVTASQAGNASYTAAPSVAQPFKINPATIHVTVTGSQTYGGTPAFTETDDAPTGVTLSGVPACTGLSPSGTITTSLAVGSYTLDGTTCSGVNAPNANYAVAYKGGSFSVSKAAIPVTITGTSVYGDAASFVTTTLPAGVTGTATCTATTDPYTIGSSLPAGTYTIDGSTCSGLTTDGNHTVAYAGGSYIVTQRNLAVMVSGSQTYGSSSPSFSGSIAPTSGVTLDGTGLNCTTVNGGTGITPHLIVAGSYTIDPTSCSGATLGGANAGNYRITYGAGAFTISRAPLNVAVSGTQTYGNAPTWAPDYSKSIFANGEDLSVISGGLSCDPGDNTLHVGTYPITGCIGLGAANYAISYTFGDLTVTPRSIDVSVSGTQVYGSNPVFTANFGGADFVNGDTAALYNGQTLACNPVNSTLHVDDSPQTITGCSGLTTPDYTINYLYGSLNITPKPIVVAVSGTQVFGGTPTFTPDYTNTAFANGDTGSVVSGSLSCDTGAADTSPVGGYSIANCTGLLAGDYTIGYSYGSLTVTPKPITVVVNGTQIYGGSPSYTPDYSAVQWVGSDDPTVVTGPTGCATDVTASSGVGTAYGVTGCVLTAANYSITVLKGTFTVTKAHLTVTADNKTVMYGDPVPALTATISGFVLSQTLATSGVTGVPSCNTTYTPTTPTTKPGTTATPTITCTLGTLAADNYDFPTFVPGTVTVQPWTLSGFYQPVNMDPTVWNTVKGGSTVPLKFQVFGHSEITATSAIAGFTTQGVSCPGSTAITDPVDFTTTGGTSLRYDTTSGQFVQNWATPKKPGACYLVTMSTQDGSQLQAKFMLK